MHKALIVAIAMAIIYAASWLLFVVIAKLIEMCFSIGFSLPMVTGIWLIVCLIKLDFHETDRR